MLALLSVTLVVLYFVAYYRKVSRYPAGPFPLPLIGNLYHIRPDNLQKYLHETGKKYGHCFTLFLPRPTVVFTDYAHIKEALVDKGDAFIGRSHLPPETHLQREVQTGVLISDGEVWREQRRTCLRILREFGMGKNLMEAQVTRSIQELLQQIKAANNGKEPFDMNTPIQLCVANIITETLFGYHFKYTETGRFEQFVAIVNGLLQCMRDNPWVMLIMGWPWLKNLPVIGSKGYHQPREKVAEFHSFIDDEIREGQASFHPDQAPATFIHAYLAEMKKNPALDLRNLHADLIDFFVAGMETTSTTLRWSLLFLMKYPRVQDKMRSELHSVVGKERLTEMADRSALPYFSASIAEIQRVANIVPILGWHVCTEDSIVQGKLIPKGTFTMPQIHSVLSSDGAFDDPSEFRPERLLSSDGKTLHKAKMERLVAFGMGKRQCIGEGLARMELFLVLAALLQRYRFEPVVPVDLTPVYGAVLVPRPYKCRVVPV